MSELHTVSDSGREAVADVVFVHGLGGDPFATWWHDEKQPKDSFLFWLADDLPTVAVHTLAYDASPSKWLGSSMPLVDRATNLLTRLEVSGIGGRPLCFVCHSLGGLVVKQTLRSASELRESAWRQLVEKTRGVVFLATPHAGTRLTDYLSALGKILRPSVTMGELAASAPLLRDLNVWYRQNAKGLGIETVAMYETRDTHGLRIVDESSADAGLGVPRAIDADHFSICKPRGRSDLVYAVVKDLLQRLSESLNVTTVVHSPDRRKKIPSIGATLDPRRHVYVVRKQDHELVDALLSHEYVNLVAPRSMGKSSMVMRAANELRYQQIDYVFIDIPGETGQPTDADNFYKPILWKVLRTIGLSFDLTDWWNSLDTQSVSQKLKEFFRNTIDNREQNHIVVFLDEIESVSGLSFADDLFLAIRAMYIERSLVHQYNRISFCLIGREHPTRFIKSTVKYDIGRTIQLRDFDRDADNLTELALFLGSDLIERWDLLERILYWTGGQPYLTMKLCVEIRNLNANSANDVDKFVQMEYSKVEIFKEDTHFYDIARIVGQIIKDNEKLRRLYISLFDTETNPDEVMGKESNDLRISGLVKRDNTGSLIIRNRIYAILFDPRRQREGIRFLPGAVA